MKSGLVVGSTLALLSASVASQTVLDDAGGRGRAIFIDGVSLQGTMERFTDPLPVATIRCGNCHASSADAAGRAPIGGTLRRSGLVRPVARRNGPPSAYTEATLCRLLRTGVDPAGIYVSGSMPRYRIVDAACHDLFAYIETRD